MKKFHVQVKENSPLVEAKMNEEIHAQAKDNSPSIENILRPISYTAWLLGVGIARPRKCPKAITIIIRMIHMAVCSYVMIRDTKYYFANIQVDIRVYIYYFIDRMIYYISTFYYIYHGIRLYNKWPELMDRLKELDQNIRKETSMNYRFLKIVEALAIFTTFIFCPLWPIIKILNYYLNVSHIVHETYIIRMLYYYILAQSLINSFVFVVVVYVLYCRFQIINKLIGQLEKLSNVQWIAFKIRRIRKLHADVCDLASMVNDIHGLHLLFCSANCFTMAIVSLFFVFKYVKHFSWVDLIQHFLFIVYSMQFCLICWICTLASQESNRTGRIMHKVIMNCQPLSLDNRDAINQSSLEMRSAREDWNNVKNYNCSSHNLYVVRNFLHKNLDQKCVRKEVNDFSIQLQQNRVVFTACDFFEMNNASFGYFVGVIVTYLILFVQFNTF
ncbi:uncharacterized protein LOC113004821 [Solenopsis invicta]|uniref:uncharacterized protein LOC113004821 n=1 Tax=Solenopsis invicta TaxID=13686 RepID=UPI00193E2728|nr:uncharacterized protein LOC113004821 [Solenopsis invicta]